MKKVKQMRLDCWRKPQPNKIKKELLQQGERFWRYSQSRGKGAGGGNRQDGWLGTLICSKWAGSGSKA